jgi:hypothetical protein
VTTRFLWEGFRLLQEIHDDVPLTYVYSDAESYEPLARIDGTRIRISSGSTVSQTVRRNG